MPDVNAIEDAVKSLPPQGLAEFRRWFSEFDTAAWDRQIEQDLAIGSLGSLLGGGASRLSGWVHKGTLKHTVSKRFWQCLSALQSDIQALAYRNYQLLNRPAHGRNGSQIDAVKLDRCARLHIWLPWLLLNLF
jgi:hypothetical protein